MKNIPVDKIQQAVLRWYKENGRHDLLWRNLDKIKIDIPYGVMVSEFMLQQTQVDRVAVKYKAFLHFFPTIKKLAQATPAKVVTLWSGLGYNRRAIYLHNAAKRIVEQYHGKIPESVEELESLPGIGEYTANAILAFGYGQNVVVIDTNIQRFYELLFLGYAKPSSKLKELAALFVPPNKSREWHNALMDLMTEVRTKKTPVEQQTYLLTLLSLKPTWTLPKLTHQPLSRPRQTPFHRSLRYYRGQIIAHLRDAKSHKASFAQIKKLLKTKDMPKEYSPKDLVAGLKQDKLIHYKEPLTAKTSISL